MKVFIFLMFLSNLAFAQNNFCTRWTKQANVSCIFSGKSASLWARQCENPCNRNYYGPYCDLTQICIDQDPNELNSYCSEWTEQSGHSCYNPNTNRWEQKWARACVAGYATTWCSDENPNRE